MVFVKFLNTQAIFLHKGNFLVEFCVLSYQEGIVASNEQAKITAPWPEKSEQKNYNPTSKCGWIAERSLLCVIKKSWHSGKRNIPILRCSKNELTHRIQMKRPEIRPFLMRCCKRDYTNSFCFQGASANCSRPFLVRVYPFLFWSMPSRYKFVMRSPMRA